MTGAAGDAAARGGDGAGAGARNRTPGACDRWRCAGPTIRQAEMERMKREFEHMLQAQQLEIDALKAAYLSDPG